MFAQHLIDYREQEKAAIHFPDSSIVTSLSDTAIFVDALNGGSVDSLAPRLAPNVAIASENTNNTIEGRAQALGFLAARLEGLNGCGSGSHLAVAGLLETEEDLSHACAILYDRFHKSCVVCLCMNRQQLVGRILLSAAEGTLRRARPLEPPAFPQAPVLPSLAPLG